ncbi:hypothetical protein BDV18DRAFT_40834 [Aspergillus unguis]
MAPVPYRPPPTPLIQQRPLLAPSFAPIQPTSFIPRKLFFQLLAGTVCIFILGVSIWKFPRFLRFFTKARVLREGNKTTTRYTKTWYGWVSPRHHAARKCVVGRCMGRLRNWFSWRSSWSDFEWVWGDLGQKELWTYRQKESQRNPTKIKSRGLAASDGMWNFMTPSNPSSIPVSGLGSPSVTFVTGALPHRDTGRFMFTPIRRPIHTSTGSQEGFGGSVGCSTPPRLHRARITQGFGSETSSNGLSYMRNGFTSSPQLPLPRSSDRAPTGLWRHTQLTPPSYSTPCLPQSRHFPVPEVRSTVAIGVGCEEGHHVMIRRSRKYQAWSARLGLQTLKCLGYSSHTLPRGPPGSPRTAVLGTLSFDSTVLERTYLERASSSGISDLSLWDDEKPHNHTRLASLSGFKKDECPQEKWQSLPLFHNYSSAFRRPTLITWHEDLSKEQPDSLSRAAKQGKDEREPIPRHCGSGRAPDYEIRPRNWSNWEVRLIDNLQRKLEWISDQFTPGVRPFHFALLANHWLNKKTWIVYDPISRVNLDNRRRWGDPRFNVPYPQPPPRMTPTPKYPKSNRRPVTIPKINSWRLAVNRNRRASGWKDFIQGIDLFDSSADDPPDGRIDPACWVLRRPPQGFAPSAREGEKYYEGGAGWQETFNDWQRIRRGYRIRKAIYEGRVNRTRVKEVVYAISRSYRQTTSRFRQSVAGYG